MVHCTHTYICYVLIEYTMQKGIEREARGGGCLSFGIPLFFSAYAKQQEIHTNTT